MTQLDTAEDCRPESRKRDRHDEWISTSPVDHYAHLTKRKRRSFRGSSAYHSLRNAHGSYSRDRAASSRSTSRRAWSPTEQDRDGHMIFETGQVLGRRYEIVCQEPLGEGTFGKVLECRELGSNHRVAVKVVRNISKYRSAARTEARTLTLLRRARLSDPILERGRTCSVSLRDEFTHRGHKCLVFDILGPSLYAFLEKNSFRGFHISYVRSIAKQLLSSIAYAHSQSLCHTDLKPENILLQSRDIVTVAHDLLEPSSSRVKVIDFGSATFETEHHSSVVSTRHYRAPEIILGMGWSYPCDLWSAGCIIVELFTGITLFETHSNLEHLAMMERTLDSPLPERFSYDCSSSATKYFNGPKLNWPEGADDDKSIAAVASVTPIQAILRREPELLSLMLALLQPDPARRPTAHAALDHAFFA